MQEMWVRFLGWEDPLEKKMATHSNILAWEIPWTEKPGGLQAMGLQRVRYNWATKQQHIQTCVPLHFYFFFLSWQSLLSSEMCKRLNLQFSAYAK